MGSRSKYRYDSKIPADKSAVSLHSVVKKSEDCIQIIYSHLSRCGCFFCVSYCSKKCLSIKIEQFVAIFPRRGKALFKVVNHTFELIFFIYMIPFAWSYMMSSVHSGQLSPACGIPMYYIQAAPFVSFILVAFRVLQRWIIEFRVARGENVYDPAHPERNTPESFIQANAETSEGHAVEAGIDNRINTIKHSNEEEH